MKIELVPATSNDELALSRLMQLYVHDFSEFMDLDIGDDALFQVGDVLSRCWSEPSRHAFLCRVDERLAGFVILDERSRLTDDRDVMDIAEFFILRRYRRKGIGFACATLAFDLFPRKWEVRQRPSNTAATAFWRRTIERYTGDRFKEALVDDEHWRGPVQSFDARTKKQDESR